jgi:sugar transferase (PEP-CTERM system associated)
MRRILLRRFTARSITLILFETALIVLAVSLATFIRLGHGPTSDESVGKVITIVLILQTCLYYADLYNPRVIPLRRELFMRIMHALASASFLLAVVYYWFPGMVIGRGVFIVASAFILTLIVAWRIAFGWFSRRLRPSERLLLVGTNAAAVTLARELFEMRDHLGVEIVGFVDPDPAKVGAAVINPGVIGTIEDIPSIVRARSVDRVVVSLADARGKLPIDKLLEMKLNGVTFDHLASVYEEYTGKIAVENLRPSWLIFSDGFRKSRALSLTKRALDVVVAGIALVFAVPLMVLIAVAIRLTSPGAALYHQNRVGQHGRIFTLHKFRSMRADAEAHTGPVWASKEGDVRVTRLGAWLRRVRLDELPQLWNVLKGDMSIVGPRPERPEFVAELTTQIPFYGQRNIVRPGLTGWAQVRYTYGASVEDAMQKLQYDLFYIKNLSIALDVFIIAATIKTVLLHKGA